LDEKRTFPMYQIIIRNKCFEIWIQIPHPKRRQKRLSILSQRMSFLKKNMREREIFEVDS
jgi:hypothetical protein